MADVKVTRWNPKANYVGDKPMYVVPTGRWVKHSDYEALLEENRQLREEVEHLKIANETQLLIRGIKP